MRIPTAKQEQFLNQYLTENYKFTDDTKKIALDIMCKFKKPRFQFGYENYLYIVVLWKRGFFNKRYPNRRLTANEVAYIEFKEILRNLSKE